MIEAMIARAQALRILRGALALIADDAAGELQHGCAYCQSPMPGQHEKSCPSSDAAEAARLVNYCDAMQILSRAIWHLTPTRKLHDRVRGENMHATYFTYDDPAMFVDDRFDRFASFGGNEHGPSGDVHRGER